VGEVPFFGVEPNLPGESFEVAVLVDKLPGFLVRLFPDGHHNARLGIGEGKALRRKGGTIGDLGGENGLLFHG